MPKHASGLNQGDQGCAQRGDAISPPPPEVPIREKADQCENTEESTDPAKSSIPFESATGQVRAHFAFGNGKRSQDESRYARRQHCRDGVVGCRACDQGLNRRHCQYGCGESREATTTSDARASARSAASGSERSVRKRQTRLIDPATSATTSSPRPRTPRLPANSPAVIDHVPTPRPQTTETIERRSALRSSAWRSSSKEE